MQYVGESEWTLQERFSEHKSYAINLKINKATGEYFSQGGHKVSDMRVSILEKIFSSDAAVRKERVMFLFLVQKTYEVDKLSLV